MAFTDSASYRANNCVAIGDTNGVDLYATSNSPASTSGESGSVVAKFQQQPPTPKTPVRQHVNVMLDTAPLTDVLLPPGLTPTAPPLNGSFGVGEFYLQADKKTGVLALGSFSGADFIAMQEGLVQGLLTLKSLGATQLIVDVVSRFFPFNPMLLNPQRVKQSNNGGGFICVAHFLHRIVSSALYYLVTHLIHFYKRS